MLPTEVATIDGEGPPTFFGAYFFVFVYSVDGPSYRGSSSSLVRECAMQLVMLVVVYVVGDPTPVCSLLPWSASEDSPSARVSKDRNDIPS